MLYPKTCPLRAYRELPCTTPPWVRLHSFVRSFLHFLGSSSCHYRGVCTSGYVCTFVRSFVRSFRPSWVSPLDGGYTTANITYSPRLRPNPPFPTYTDTQSNPTQEGSTRWESANTVERKRGKPTYDRDLSLLHLPQRGHEEEHDQPGNNTSTYVVHATASLSLSFWFSIPFFRSLSLSSSALLGSSLILLPPWCQSGKSL